MGELTIEAALLELREMFPDRMTLITRNDTLAFVNPTLNQWVMVFRHEPFRPIKIGEGITLNEAMDQVRKWYKGQQ